MGASKAREQTRDHIRYSSLAWHGLSTHSLSRILYASIHAYTYTLSFIYICSTHYPRTPPSSLHPLHHPPWSPRDSFHFISLCHLLSFLSSVSSSFLHSSLTHSHAHMVRLGDKGGGWAYPCSYFVTSSSFSPFFFEKSLKKVALLSYTLLMLAVGFCPIMFVCC